MKRTSDKQAILSLTKEFYGKEIDGAGLIEKWGGHVIEFDNGFVMCIWSRPGVYRVTFAFKSGELKASDAVNQAFSWMFENTDAEVLEGIIQPDNAPLIAMRPDVWGAELEDKGNIVLGTVTRDRWEKARQVKK